MTPDKPKANCNNPRVGEKAQRPTDDDAMKCAEATSATVWHALKMQRRGTRWPSRHFSNVVRNQILDSPTVFSHSIRRRGHYGCVNCLRFSRDGSFLVSGSDDMRLLLWDTRHLASQIPSAELQTPHWRNIFSCSVDHTQRYLLSTGSDGLLVRSTVEALRAEQFSGAGCRSAKYRYRPRRVAAITDSSGGRGRNCAMRPSGNMPSTAPSQQQTPGGGTRVPQQVVASGLGPCYQAEFLNFMSDVCLACFETPVLQAVDFRESSSIRAMHALRRATSSAELSPIYGLDVRPCGPGVQFAYTCQAATELLDLRKDSTAPIVRYRDVVRYGSLKEGPASGHRLWRGEEYLRVKRRRTCRAPLYSVDPLLRRSPLTGYSDEDDDDDDEDEDVDSEEGTDENSHGEGRRDSVVESSDESSNSGGNSLLYIGGQGRCVDDSEDDDGEAMESYLDANSDRARRIGARRDDVGIDYSQRPTAATLAERRARWLLPSAMRAESRNPVTSPDTQQAPDSSERRNGSVSVMPVPPLLPPNETSVADMAGASVNATSTEPHTRIDPDVAPSAIIVISGTRRAADEQLPVGDAEPLRELQHDCLSGDTSTSKRDIVTVGEVGSKRQVFAARETCQLDLSQGSSNLEPPDERAHHDSGEGLAHHRCGDDEAVAGDGANISPAGSSNAAPSGDNSVARGTGDVSDSLVIASDAPVRCEAMGQSHPLLEQFVQVQLPQVEATGPVAHLAVPSQARRIIDGAAGLGVAAAASNPLLFSAGPSPVVGGADTHRSHPISVEGSATGSAGGVAAELGAPPEKLSAEAATDAHGSTGTRSQPNAVFAGGRAGKRSNEVLVSAATAAYNDFVQPEWVRGTESAARAAAAAASTTSGLSQLGNYEWNRRRIQWVQARGETPTTSRLSSSSSSSSTTTTTTTSPSSEQRGSGVGIDHCVYKEGDNIEVESSISDTGETAFAADVSAERRKIRRLGGSSDVTAIVEQCGNSARSEGLEGRATDTASGLDHYIATPVTAAAAPRESASNATSSSVRPTLSPPELISQLLVLQQLAAPDRQLHHSNAGPQQQHITRLLLMRQRQGVVTAGAREAASNNTPRTALTSSGTPTRGIRVALCSNRSLSNPRAPLTGGERVTFSHNGELLLVIRHSRLPVVYAVEFSDPLFELLSDTFVNTCTLKSGCFFADDRTIAIGSEDKQIHLWKLPDRLDLDSRIALGLTEQIPCYRKLYGHRSIVNCCVSPGPDWRGVPYLASSGVENMIRFWIPTKLDKSCTILDRVNFLEPTAANSSAICPASLENERTIARFDRLFRGFERRHSLSPLNRFRGRRWPPASAAVLTLDDDEEEEEEEDNDSDGDDEEDQPAGDNDDDIDDDVLNDDYYYFSSDIPDRGHVG